MNKQRYVESWKRKSDRNWFREGDTFFVQLQEITAILSKRQTYSRNPANVYILMSRLHHAIYIWIVTIYTKHTKKHRITNQFGSFVSNILRTIVFVCTLHLPIRKWNINKLPAKKSFCECESLVRVNNVDIGFVYDNFFVVVHIK